MKPPGYKGMESNEASMKKIAGHINEEDYAEIIHGEVSKGSPTGKKDVIDGQHSTHSVKSGKKWQIFLYGRSRLISNTVLKGLGNIAPLMVECLDTLPANRDNRNKNPEYFKKALQKPMRNLAIEIAKPNLLEAFFQKAAFEAGEVNFLAILDPDMDQAKVPLADKHYYIFDAKEAINIICSQVEVTNSKARGKGQMDDQKVIFRTHHNIGEIEIRTDRSNYGRIKMWLQANRILDLLKDHIKFMGNPVSQISVFGKASRLKIPTSV